MAAFTSNVTVRSDRLLPVSPEAASTVTVTSTAGDTVYYADSPTTTATTNQGSIAVGSAVTFSTTIWLRSASRTDVRIAYADVTLTSGEVPAPVAAVPAQLQANGLYLYSYFRDDDSSLYIAVSGDGLNWIESSQRLYQSPNPNTSANHGGVRDPDLWYHTDGYWYCCYTAPQATQANSQFEIARSPDLINWSFYKRVTTVGLKTTWAPRHFYDADGSLHVIFAGFVNGTLASATKPAVIYETHPLTSDLSGSWSNPVQIFQGINSSGNGQDSIIDPFLMIAPGGTAYAGKYVLFFKDDDWQDAHGAGSTTWYPNTQWAVGSSMFGPFTIQTSGNPLGLANFQEGPNIHQTTSGTYRISVDAGGSGLAYPSVYYAESSDLQTWTPSGMATVNFPSKARHGLVTRTTDVKSLRDAHGYLMRLLRQAPYFNALTVQSLLVSQGARIQNYRFVTTFPAGILATDDLIGIGGSGARSIFLQDVTAPLLSDLSCIGNSSGVSNNGLEPTYTQAGRVITIKDVTGNAAAGNITVSRHASTTQLLDGAATAVIATNFGSVRVFTDGANSFLF